jgi:hypothetical protein
MTGLRLRLLALSIAIAAPLAAAPAANAWSQAVSAPVYRSGSRVGTAHATLVLASNGWAIVNARVVGFRAPSSNHSWRTRTSISTSCTDPGFDPSSDNGDDFHIVAVNASSPWRTTRIAGTTGNLTTNDFVKECPSGQVPGPSFLLTLTVQNPTGATRVGFAQLFAAG